jgi:DNA-binding protein HU-beta
MRKAELIEAVTKKMKLTHDRAVSKADVEALLDSFTGVVTDTLKIKGEVDLFGFGKFSTSQRAAREGRNPQTGDAITIAASTVAKFRPAKALKDAVNNPF